MKYEKGKQKNLIEKVKTIADYQFGEGAGEALFPDFVEFILSKTGRISQIFENEKRIATLRSFDGLLTLSIEGAKRLHRIFKYPSLRAVMNDESSDFIRNGGTAFCKHVINADPEIRAYDEVILVDKEDNLLGTGKAMLSGEEMKIFTRGVGVKVRHGIGE
jgi:predicted RNA-binding protein (TIGR00451 family)